MSNVRISDLADGAALDGSELLEITQSGASYKTTAAALGALGGGPITGLSDVATDPGADSLLLWDDSETGAEGVWIQELPNSFLSAAVLASLTLADSSVQPGDDVSDLANDAGYLTAEVNDLSAAVTWANIPDGNVPASAVTQHQAALSIAGSQLTGSIADARLSANVPLLNASNVFTGGINTFNSPLAMSSAVPQMRWFETGVTADEGAWAVIVDSEVFTLRAYNDAFAISSQFLRVLRTGTTVDEIELNATTLDFNGAADFSGNVALAGELFVANSTTARLWLRQTGAASNEKYWAEFANSGDLTFRIYNDALDATTDWMKVFRSGMTIDEIQLDATTIDINGAIDASSGITAAGVIRSTVAASGLAGSFDARGSQPGYALYSTAASANNHYWLNYASATQHRFGVWNDAGSANTQYLIITRSGSAISEIELNATLIDVNGLLATQASASGGAGLNVPHGAAPSSPNDGDVWTTTAGLFARINGATVQFATV